MTFWYTEPVSVASCHPVCVVLRRSHLNSSQQPLVSVLVPICNVERYLDQCLGSLVTQTYDNLEVICINDGSTDGSKAIIDGFVSKDSRFTCIDKPNSGYGDSMNKGLEAACGTYVSILESDDFLDPEGIAYMVDAAETQDLEVFKCNFWLHWTCGLPEYSYRNNVYFPFSSPEMVGMGPHAPRDYPQVFWGKASIWSALYRKSLLDENNIRFLPTPGASYQDSSFTFKVLSCCVRIAYSERAFLHYRQDNEHSSVNSKGKVYCTCDEHAEMSHFLDEDRPDLKPALDPVRAYVKFLNYAWNYDRLADQFKPEFLERFSTEMRQEIERGTIPPCVLDGSVFKDVDVAPFQYFWKEQVEELRDVAYNKEFYAAQRASRAGGGKVATFKNYWHAGGLGGIAKLVARKAQGKA